MKIAIPKEAITQIMSDYDCSEEEAAKAYLNAEDRAKKELFVRKNKELRDLGIER